MTSKSSGVSAAAGNVASWECGEGAGQLIGEGVAGCCGPGALSPEIALSADGWWWKPWGQTVSCVSELSYVGFPTFLKNSGQWFVFTLNARVH